jgi:4-amino-4-deoxy-L-arabinose transferase-like glycosyltransferase
MATSASTRDEIETRHWMCRLGAALAALLAVRLAALHYNATDLFFDEAQYWSWSGEPAFGYYSKPPLIAWLIHVASESCGHSEFCVRLPSPLMHTATALAVFAVAARLYGGRTGFWSALVFATLPGVSLSAGIISTDVPLLFFWALALYALILLIDGRSWWPAGLLGLALGLGLNAKYAMAYFVLCTGLYVIATPERRWLLRDKRLYTALALSLLLIAPNLVWNYLHSFATFAHTADNAKWTGSLFNPGRALEFFGSQFGVFGPILFGALLIVTVRACRQRLPAADRLLIAFALPVLIVVTIQALLSRAHANWAAVSYVAATVLVTASLLRDHAQAWLRGTLALHGVVLALIAFGTTWAGSFRLPGAGDPFARTLGWRALALEAEAVLEAHRQSGAPFATVLTDDRAVTAELLYYLRKEGTPVLAWRDEGRPRDHYELTRPFARGAAEPVLLVSLRRDAGKVTRQFAVAERLSERQIPAGAGEPRRVVFYRLASYRGN